MIDADADVDVDVNCVRLNDNNRDVWACGKQLDDISEGDTAMMLT